MPDKATVIESVALPARPARLAVADLSAPSAMREGALIVLQNYFLRALLSPLSGMIESIVDRGSGEKFDLIRDCAGVILFRGDQRLPPFILRTDNRLSLQCDWRTTAECAEVRFAWETENLLIEITYELRHNRFWIERRLRIDPRDQPVTFEQLVYGRLEIRDGNPRILELGKYDRPRLVQARGAKGGLFAGVGWWFYSVDKDGVYQNNDMQYACDHTFLSEPWYIGLLAPEPGEPWVGWSWYKTFLEDRKAEHDRQKAWCHWNAGWGMPGIDVDHPRAEECLQFAKMLGLPHVLFGHGMYGHGQAKYIALSESDPATRRTLALAKEQGIVVGSIEPGNDQERWTDDARQSRDLALLDDFHRAGFGALHFDFFHTPDTYRAHRNVAAYFRATQALMQYTECHLGMAAYGPQFQREVVVNHPADLHHFSIQPFSADWCTFLGFRSSRRDWQRQYQYLMPEYGLYYFITHYMNPAGEFRRYTDPEPQQFLCTIPAYTGIGFNFHDPFGFRTAVVAGAAFSPFVVMGFLEMRMPAAEVEFLRLALRWVRENADTLRPARICYEDEQVAVVSKIRGRRGLIFALNYLPGSRTVALKLQTGIPGPIQLQQVFPVLQEPFERRDGEILSVELPGSRLIVFMVNEGLASLPPECPRGRPLDLERWSRTDEGWRTDVVIPDVEAALKDLHDPTLPREIESFDQRGHAFAPVTPDKCLPRLFLDAYGFRDDRYVETWKVAPWAFADRVWLVWTPAGAPCLGAPLPRVRVNGVDLRLYPRVDTRVPEAGAHPEQWLVACATADITSVCNFGGDNVIEIADVPNTPGGWHIACAAFPE